jgi:hypothetical protein
VVMWKSQIGRRCKMGDADLAYTEQPPPRPAAKEEFGQSKRARS